jgi:hypothetical protein
MTTVTAFTRTALAAGVSAAAVLAMAGQAPARPPFPIVAPVGVAACTQPEGQVCPEISSAPPIDPRTPQVKVEFTASPDHCSSMVARLVVDGKVGSGTYHQPGQSDSQIIALGPGQHVIGIQAEGRPVGCNTGRLASWAGTLRIEEVGDPYRGDGALPPPP